MNLPSKGAYLTERTNKEMTFYPYTLRLLVAVFFLFFVCAGYSETPASLRQEKITSAPAPKSGPAPSVVLGALTVDQIRVQLDRFSDTAGKFEFLRSIRKSTIENLADTNSKLATVNVTLAAQQDARSKAEGSVSFREPELPSRGSVAQRVVAARSALASAQSDVESLKRNKKSRLEDIKKAEEVVSGTENEVADLQNLFDNYESISAQRKKEASDRENANNKLVEEITELTTQRDSLSTQAVVLQELVGDIDDMANQLFIASDATNKFKLTMSAAFAVLVALVIAGFFWIASSNDEIKKTIFSNEAGIQFITLFSIVIAVILFGIIGVLESKELSALLGGLSGYILGRSTGSRTQVTPQN